LRHRAEPDVGLGAAVVQARELSGRVAVVTGASRGIGRALAEGLAAAGADVVVASRKLEACQIAAAEIEAATGRRALPVSCNVSHWDQCEQLVEETYRAFGHCEVLVNNAGLSPLYSDLVSVTEELYDKTHAVNAKGPFRLASLFGARMHADLGGSIINVSTVAAWRPGPGELPYAMAKAGLNALTLGLVGAFAPKVRANTVVLGPFDTDVAKAWPSGTVETLARTNPLGRIGRPEDLVALCVFLASDASGYVNGAQILVDGGSARHL
jgi:NAD(P)-dependent dehydrogenase (short-subunit alcohol dehydrogenase family)